MDRREELTEMLERHYCGCGWSVTRASDGTVRAEGIGGVTWIGLAVMPEDLESEGFGERLVELSRQRMPTGQLCPFELLPAEECRDLLEAALRELGLADRGHVEVYSLAA